MMSAVAALVMADMLDSEDATVLYDPWSKVIGEPLLPVYEDEGEDDEDEEDGDEEDDEESDESCVRAESPRANPAILA